MDPLVVSFSGSRLVQQRQLLIQERWPEMNLGCTACVRWKDVSRPECCGDCGIAATRRLLRQPAEVAVEVPSESLSAQTHQH